jgi:hypothetical protein
VTITVSLLLCSFLWSSFSVSRVLALLWAKIISNLLVGLLFIVFGKEATIFYNNLGYSSSKMYWGSMLMDLFIWAVMTSIVILLQ